MNKIFGNYNNYIKKWYGSNQKCIWCKKIEKCCKPQYKHIEYIPDPCYGRKTKCKKFILDFKKVYILTANAGPACFKRMLREVNLAGIIPTPGYISEPNNIKHSEIHDGLIKIVDIEADAKDMANKKEQL
jgi:hypothetical protein